MISTPKTMHLVQTIEQHLGRALQPQVRAAFLQVPRHLFVEHYFQQCGNSLTWDLIASPRSEEIYQDDALVTKLDERGMPISSSSKPSVMALQLEALDLRPGLSVLEIGTGTGYNAALMGVLVRPTGQVISIDIDRGLVTIAIDHLSTAGIKNVLAREEDGFEGDPTYAPYDRLLATCAVRTLPRAWMAQLAQGGKLVVNARLNLASIFLCLTKIDNTVLGGHLLNIDAAYMEMYGAASLASFPCVIWQQYDTQPQHEIHLPINLSELLNNSAYSVLLQSLIPACFKKYRADPDTDNLWLYLIDPSAPGSALLIREDHVTLIGHHERLEKALLQSIDWYTHFCPNLEDYRVTLHASGASLYLHDRCLSLVL